MCGIYGQWNRDGSRIDLDQLVAATTSLWHRGPDDEGYLLANTGSGRVVLCGGADTTAALQLPPLAAFEGDDFDFAFGFRRLSILDLSPAGHQPMASSNGTCWLVFNGEIYNYLELRRELVSLGHVFKTGTDTEVILAAYTQWGRQSVQRMRGMWAFAIWDSTARALFLSRDRFGIKPLYLSSDAARLTFASETKALITGGVAFSPSPVALGTYVALGRLPCARDGDTFFQGIVALPAAHSMVVTAATERQYEYWSTPPVEPESEPRRPQDIVEQYGAILTDAIRVHLRADVPIGTCLSGGLDSSSIVAITSKLLRDEHAAALQRLGTRQQTFSAIYDTAGPWDERRHIDRVLAATGAAGNFVLPTAERLWRDLDKLIWHQDEPFTTTSIFAQWCVMDLARQRGATVLLDGQGSDEVNGGYYSIYGPTLRDLAYRGRLVTAAREARAARRVAGVAGERLLIQHLARLIPGVVPVLRKRRTAAFEMRLAPAALSAPVTELLREEWRRGAMPDLQRDHNGAEEYLRFAISTDPLPNLLRFEDRNTMAFSIEGRVPFLDHLLVEFVFRHAGSFRVRDGWTKWVQRVAIAPLLPDDIAWRRDKVGFDTPQHLWFRDLPSKLGEAMERAPVTTDLVDPDRLRKVSDPHVMWRWLCCATWLGVFQEAAGRSNRQVLRSLPTAAVSPS
jgi:asparagine synthase (glutamine-hydrolysing)